MINVGIFIVYMNIIDPFIVVNCVGKVIQIFNVK